VKESPGGVRYLTPEERATLLEGAPPALHPYIVAALHTGARRGELLGLRWTDIDMRTRSVTFPKTKNGDSRSVPMTDTLRELLASLARPMNAEAPVFPTWTPAAFTVAFGRLVRDLKLANLHFHDLRHDTASTLTMAGVLQRTVMALHRHRDPRMTLRYQHLSPEHLREAVRVLEQRPQAGHALAVAGS